MRVLLAVALFGLVASASAQFQTNYLIFTDSACTGSGTAYTGEMVNNLPACRSYGTGGSKAFCVPAGTPGAPDGSAEINLYSDAACATLSGGVNNAKPNDGVCYATQETGKWLKFTSCVPTSSGGTTDPVDGGGEAENPALVLITTGGSLYTDVTCATATNGFTLNALFEPVSEDVAYECIAVGERFMRGACVPGDLSTQEGEAGNWRVRFYSADDCETGYLGQAEGESLSACVQSSVAGTDIFVKVDGCSSSDAAAVKGSIVAALAATLLAFIATKMQL